MARSLRPPSKRVLLVGLFSDPVALRAKHLSPSLAPISRAASGSLPSGRPRRLGGIRNRRIRAAMLRGCIFG